MFGFFVFFFTFPEDTVKTCVLAEILGGEEGHDISAWHEGCKHGVHKFTPPFPTHLAPLKLAHLPDNEQT